MKKIHVGTVSYANEAMDEVSSYVRQCFTPPAGEPASLVTPSSAYAVPVTSATRMRREIGSRVRDVVLALALCHNVTPTTEEENGEVVTTYQASSPDEIAIVRWTEAVGLKLLQRDRESMSLESVNSGNTVVRVRILNTFPFTSEGKRMGIVVRFYHGPVTSSTDEDGEIWFYQKGADTVMTSIVAANDWLDEETANMAREGLRTLVVGRKKLSAQTYTDFSSKLSQASLALQNRDANVAEVISEYLERDLELLGVTGVEDKLQKDVKPSLELLRNAGIKIWMLTGDKVETARCVAVSSKLVARGQYIHTIQKRILPLFPSSHPTPANTLSSKAQRPRPLLPRLPSRQNRRLPPHRRRIPRPDANPLPHGLHLPSRPTPYRRRMPMLAHAESRRRTPHPLLHEKTRLLHRRRRQRRQHDPSRGRGRWYRGQRRPSGLSRG